MTEASDSFTVARNTAYLFASEIVTKVLSFFLIIAMARILGDVVIGKYFFAVAYVGTFMIFSDFGVTTLMFREVSKNTALAQRYFSNVFTFRTITAIAVLIIAVVAVPLSGKSAEIGTVVALVAAYFLLTEMIQPFRILFNAYEKLQYYALTSILQIFILALFGVLVLFMGHGLIEVLYIFIFSYLASLIAAIAVLNKRFVRFRPEIDIQFWKFLVRKSWPFWMTGLFMVVYTRVDTLMLTAMKDYAVVGWYNAALKMVEALNFIPFVLIGAIFPALAKFSSGQRLLSDKLYKKTFYYLFLIILPIAIGTTMLAERIIFFIYKEQFLNASAALQILIWAEMFFFASFLTGYLLNAIDKAKLFTLTAGITLLANAALNAVLIPMFKTYEGAAIATVATQAVNMAVLIYFAKKSGYSPEIKVLAKAVIAGAIMAAAIYLLNPLHILIIVPVAAAVYVCALYLVKGVGEEEKRLIRFLISGARTKIFK